MRPSAAGSIQGAMAAAMRAKLEQLPGGNATAAAHFATVSHGLLDYVFTLSGAQINSTFGSRGHVKGYASLGPAACPEGGCDNTGARVPRPSEIENFCKCLSKSQLCLAQ